MVMDYIRAVCTQASHLHCFNLQSHVSSRHSCHRRSQSIQVLAPHCVDYLVAASVRQITVGISLGTLDCRQSIAELRESLVYARLDASSPIPPSGLMPASPMNDNRTTFATT